MTRLFRFPLLAALSLSFGCGGEDPPLDQAPPAICGNGVREANEECDGPPENRCEALGRGTGTPRCGAGCVLDLSGCSARPVSTCGNGRLDEGERCDGTLLAGVSCESLGLGTGVLACSERCSELDTRNCSEAPSCTPRTCAERVGMCGSLDDGCGGTLDCGDTCSSKEPWLTCVRRHL